jgi:Epoxide hydrolase N terminus
LLETGYLRVIVRGFSSFDTPHNWGRKMRGSFVSFWLTCTSRRKCEKHINSFPNFLATVSQGNEEYTIHFVALFSEKRDAVPLVLFHGWPGMLPYIYT